MDNRGRKLLLLCALLAGCCLAPLLAGEGEKEIAAVSGGVKAAQPAGETGKSTGTVRIYVSGAVLAPGLYDLPEGSRADAAVAAAGGFGEDADVNRVNLARNLKDGAHVSVPEVKVRKKGGSGKTAGKKAGDAALPVNINTASAEELETLPGIGPAMAARIIACREAQPFASPEGLLKVPGIGKARLERLRPLVTVR